MEDCNKCIHFNVLNCLPTNSVYYGNINEKTDFYVCSAYRDLKKNKIMHIMEHPFNRCKNYNEEVVIKEYKLFDTLEDDLMTKIAKRYTTIMNYNGSKFHRILHKEFGVMNYYPKANKIHFHKDCKWIENGSDFLKKLL